MTNILCAVFGLGHGADGNGFDEVLFTFSFHGNKKIVIRLYQFCPRADVHTVA